MFSRISLGSILGKSGVTSINSACNNLQSIRFATKKAGGSVRNGRDSAGRRLGVKKFGGEHVMPGYILIRQRGLKYRSGENTYLGRDDTIHAKIEGYVKFTLDKIRKRQVVSVSLVNPNIPKKVREPVVEEEAAAAQASM